jgi:hypothetical protein
VIKIITGLNQYAIVMYSYAVMAGSRNGFLLFEKVSFLAPIKVAYLQKWVVEYMHEKVETLVYITSNIQDCSCSCNEVSNYTALKAR